MPTRTESSQLIHSSVAGEAFIFAVSMYCWRLMTKCNRGNNSNHEKKRFDDIQNSPSDSNNPCDESSCSPVSKRCMALSHKSPLPYISSFLKAISNPCHPINNRNGYIALCVAENKLIIPILSEHLTQHQFAKVGFGNEVNFCYNDTRGLENVRKAVARFITKRFIKPSSGICDEADCVENDKSGIPCCAMAHQIVLGSGAAAILNFLFHCIADENEVVLIPAPYYAAFEYDMSVLAKCVPYPVHMDNPRNGPQPEELEKVYQHLTYQGLKVKVLLLTNPNNPLGTIYSPSVLRNCVDWARSKNMHTIVDEIYALSIHHDAEDGNQFHSVTRILENKLGHDVHFIWALSKDFGASGLRVGILYTQNNTILSSFGNINMFSGVGGPMQAIVAKLLSDDDYIDKFLHTSRELLRASYDKVTQGLEEINIPFVPAQAGIFVYCDFSSLLRVNTFEGEDELAELFEQHARIVMTPGSSQNDNKPGFFRICYAFVTPEVLTIGITRLQSICRLLKETGWENIGHAANILS